MTPVRRSGRARKQATSVYDEAKKAIEEEEKEKEKEKEKERSRRRSRSKAAAAVRSEDEDNDDDEASENGGVTDDESAQEDQDEEIDEEEEESEDEDDDEDFQTAKPATSKGGRKARKVSPAKSGGGTPSKKTKQSAAKKRGGGKKVQIQVKPSRKRRSTPKKGRGSRAGAGPIGRRGINQALANLAKKVLEPSETPGNSLAAGLLGAHRADLLGPAPRSDDTKFSAPDFGPSHRPTAYTANLTLLARSVVAQHNSDPNAAQTRLLNLLFRSVGGTVGTNLDPAQHTLEDMNDEDWGTAITDLVDEMRHTPADRTLICADPEGAVHAEKGDKHVAGKASAGSLGLKEYRKIYEEFWYVLGGVALSEGGMANTSGAARVSDDEEEEDEDEVENSSDDESDDDDEGATPSRKRKSTKAKAKKTKGKIKKRRETFPTASIAIRYDAELVRDLIGRAIELVSVGQPDVRAAAVIAVYRMGQAVLDRTVHVGQKLEIAARQLAAASKRGSSSKAESLGHQVDSLKRTRADLEEVVLGPVIQGVFVHRYRDSNVHIRATSLEALSGMTQARPDLFLMDKYLKYFGWMLSDKAELGRLAAFEGLLAPFVAVHRAAESSDPSVIKAAEKIDLTLMEHVVAKFLPRMADCAVDVSVRVQEKAIALLLAMLRDGFLDDIEDETIWNQINLRAVERDAPPAARRDALYFVMEQLEAFDDGDDDDDGDATSPTAAARRRRSRDGGGASDSAERRTAQRLDALASWLAHTLTDGPVPIDKIDVGLADNLVHSLRSMPEHRSLVTDWSAMLRAIGNDNVAMTAHGTAAGDRADVAKQRVLVRMLATAAQAEVGAVAGPSFMLQGVDADVVAADPSCGGGDGLADDATSKSASAGVGVGGRGSKMGRASASSAAGLQHESLSVSLLKALPDLLIKFKGDSAILGSLASLPRYLIPTVFSLPQRKNDFTTLAKTLAEIYLQSTDETVLKNTALSLAYLSSGDHSRAPDGRLQLKNVSQELHDRIVELFSETPSAIAERTSRTKRRKQSGSGSPTKRRRRGRSSTPSRSSTAGDTTDNEEDADESDTAAKEADIESAIYLNMKRLRVLSKRCDLSRFLRDEDEAGASSSDEDNGVEALCSIIADGLARRLKARRVGVTEEDVNEDESKKSSPWENEDKKIPGIVASAVAEGLNFILSVTAWKLSSVVESEGLVVTDDDDIMDESNEDDDEDEIDDHVVLRLRNRVVALVELCFEQFLPEQASEEDESSPSYTPEQVIFADAVQAAAGQVVADLRNLFPKEWTEAASPLLRAFAIKDDGRLIGGFVRYFRSKEAQLRVVNDTLGNESAVQSLLLPMSRSLAVNWTFGNRREAGVVLAHITGSGQEASHLVSSLSKTMKKVDPVRLLEAHMASLRQSFEDWMDNEPEEIGSDRPTDAEMAAFEEAEKKHEEQFEALEHQAARFSNSLGVGKLSDPKLTPALLGFVREGVRFSFSNSDGDGDDEDEWALGSRLSFLRVLSKYGNWIKRNKEQKTILQEDIDGREVTLRAHPEFAEVHEDDLAALADFKTALGFKTLSVPDVDDEDVNDNGSHDEVSDLNVSPTRSRRSRASVASSVTSRLSASRSLSPLHEEIDGSDEELSEDRHQSQSQATYDPDL